MSSSFGRLGVEKASNVLESAKGFGLEAFGVAQREHEKAKITAEVTNVQSAGSALGPSESKLT